MSDLTAPIPGELPFGLYLKGERPIYRALRNAFNGSQAAWRKLSETPDALKDKENQSANAAAWAALAEQCETCLTETSKDLEILSWYVAAQLHGGKPLEKCCDAITVMVELAETSLDKMQPNPPAEKLRGGSDEAKAAEVAELRLRPFIQLFGEVEGSGLLSAPLSSLPLIGDVTFGDFVMADKDSSLDALRRDVAAHIGSEGQTLTQKIEALQTLADLIGRLDVAVKTYANAHGHTPPLIGYGTRQVNDMLQAIERLVEGLGFPWPGREQTSEAPVAETVSNSTPVAAAALTSAAGGFTPSANVSNRRDALKAIAQLATYFRTTEPHSPICLLLDRAVRWGNLSVGELYREILSDGSVGMAQLALMTGLESQGFADRYGTPSAGAVGGVEHSPLDNYAAAVPVPAPQNPIVVSTPPAPAPNAAAVPAVAASGPAPAEPAEIPAEAPGDIPEVKDFQW